MVKMIKEAHSKLQKQFETCKEAHNKYVSLVDLELPKEEINWIASHMNKLSQMNIKVATILSEKDVSKRSGGLQLEKMKMPFFNGNIRDYSRFKFDFTRQVVPEVQNDYATAYALKSCLGIVPLDTVRNVDDDLAEMWRRLDDEFRKASKLTDVIMKDIKKMRPVKDNDDKYFLELINTIE